MVVGRERGLSQVSAELLCNAEPLPELFWEVLGRLRLKL